MPGRDHPRSIFALTVDRPMVGLNCPYCGRAMAHQSSQNDWHFYRCVACGPITLPPDGLIRRTQERDFAAAIEGRHGAPTVHVPVQRPAESN